MLSKEEVFAQFEKVLGKNHGVSFGSSSLKIGEGYVKLQRVKDGGYRLQVEWDIEERTPGEVAVTKENGFWRVSIAGDQTAKVMICHSAESIFWFDKAGEQLPQIEERVGTSTKYLYPGSNYYSKGFPTYESELAACETSKCPLDEIIRRMEPRIRLLTSIPILAIDPTSNKMVLGEPETDTGSPW